MDTASSKTEIARLCVCHGEDRPHAPHQSCDKGCQPDWHRDDCAIYLPLNRPASDGDPS